MGPDDRALPKAHPPTPQRALAQLAVEFDQGTSQVDDDSLNLEAANAHMDPPLEGDNVDPTIATANVSKNTSEVKPNLISDLVSFEES